jgi:subtilase family serine protease
MRGRILVRAVGIALLALSTGVGVATEANAATPAAATPHLVQACANTPGIFHCQAIQNTAVRGPKGISPDAPSGLGPADIQSAYALPATGSTATVAIVDAYDDPDAESDLATFRSQYGLPECSTANGCFSKVDQTGGANYPTGDSGWGLEISLDLDAVSSACPTCHILLVEADSADNDLYTADTEAATLGAKYVSNSWSSGESAGETSTDSTFDQPGVLYAFATGDSGYAAGTQYPAASQYTLGVGGTTLTQDSSARGWSESAWSGAGSGCSSYEPAPSWQSGVTGCGSNKAVADISADADPNSGLATYDTYGQSGWIQVGGTSLATPLVTAMYALAGTTGDNPASVPYANTGSLNDVTSGSNGSCGTSVCDAGSGWDGPTGLGTPNGLGGV